MDKKHNPIQVVEVRRTDHRPPPETMMIENKVFGDGASEERRQTLASETRALNSYFQQSFKAWPGVSAVAKVTLKEDALAKSHRPVALFTKKSCPIIGTLDFGEILISVTERGLEVLEERILYNNTKKQEANISALRKIEPYTTDEKLQGYSADELNKILEDGIPVKVKLFDHKEDAKNRNLQSALTSLAQRNNTELSDLPYGQDGDLYALRNVGHLDINDIANFVGVRSLAPMPQFQPSDISTQMSQVSSATANECPPPDVEEDYPVVGVIDSGVCPNSSLLSPWISARESFVPPGYEDHRHGTMVAGLIANAKNLNHIDPRFPASQAKIVDVNVFPNTGTVSEEDLISAISEVVEKYASVRVWNLSLGGSTPVSHADFSDFARFLDQMHDKHGCLFVIASGNQVDAGCWPTLTNGASSNRISSPADSVRALTVGSIAHKESPATLVASEQVSPFSRVGPGPCFTPKPEVVHYGGNISASGGYAQTGVLSLGPGNMIYESIGTSFAAPIVSSQAASLFKLLSGDRNSLVSSEKVKALLVHSALCGSENVRGETLNSYGFGKPGDILDSLYCDDHCMTLVFETDVRHGGYEFERFPFPIADCLYNSEGKFRGEILMTLVYSPIVDKSYASEYCRTNVDAGLGSYELDLEDGKRKFSSKVPATPDDVNKLYERVRIEHGFKWSPVKAYHKVFPRGASINNWRLRMKVSRRAEEDQPDNPQKATLVLTLRALDPKLPVYNDMIKLMNQSGWITNDIDQHIRIRPGAGNI